MSITDLPPLRQAADDAPAGSPPASRLPAAPVPASRHLGAPVPASPVPRQTTFDELGTPLRDVTFVVVDLETTGGSPAGAEITEIGAVKVRAGEVLGEFQTLVNPMTAIPPFIAVLTGITDAMVATAPPISAVLPAFLEWSRGAVLVAHNAPFDLGFLRANADRLGVTWPQPESIDTARLARRVLTRDEVSNCKLSTLSQLFRTTTEPCHRALADARATVDVLHGLIDRLGNLGVHSLDELRTFNGQVSAAQRRKRHLAEGLPDGPGVYVFRDAKGRPLYIGKSKSVRARVRHYFVASESRSRMAEMVGIAERVDAIECAHALEAEVRELRLIAEHKPRYNRRSRFPERSSWLKLTVEPFPRLSIVRKVLDDAAAYLGPFGSVRTAEAAMAAAHEAFPIRQCTTRISSRKPTSSCVLAEMGRCVAPCLGEVTPTSYAAHAEAVRTAMTGDPGPVVEAMRERISALAAQQRYEEAAAHRDRAIAFVRAAARMQRLASLTACSELVGARRRDDGGWDLAVVRHGRLAGAAVAPRGADPWPYVAALRATAETVLPHPGPTGAASAAETECVLRWLETPGTRLVVLEGTWCSPADGAGRLTPWLEVVTGGDDAARPLDDRRGLRPVHRPARAAV